MKITNILPLFYCSVLAAAISPPSGLYTIIPEAFGHQGYVGRRQIEDRSLRPKEVLVLGGTPEAWSVERQSDGKYRLSQRGGFAGESNGRLVAFLTREQGTDRWLIDSSTEDGNDIFTLARDPSRGWITPPPNDENDRQIWVQPLIIGAGEPPFYPPTELFRFVPLYDE
ncbi:hypothetical protein V501_08024 [Pseudogymnoascus sp. VKM F-4519 (FW-2642)]|nr:hypothetical protein V501_08024 [Pseudogymnoascus sp. VKM F-4519 (FW-2642)]